MGNIKWDMIGMAEVYRAVTAGLQANGMDPQAAAAVAGGVVQDPTALSNLLQTGQVTIPPSVLVSQQAFGTDRGYARRSIDREYRRFSDDQRDVDVAIAAYNSGNAGPLIALGLSRNPAVAQQAGGGLGLVFTPDGRVGASVNAYRTPAGIQNLGLSPNALTAANLVYGYGPQGYGGALANAIGGIYAPGPVNPYVFSPQLSNLYQRPVTTGLPGNFYLPSYRSFVVPVRGPGDFQATLGMDNMDISQIMNNSSLTVEDMVTLMIMLIMQKMDQDIKREAERINTLQQQQTDYKNKNDNKEMPDSPSIDIETLKLKRLVDKRSQMFDLLRQIIDKYNQTAKGIIDTMGR